MCVDKLWHEATSARVKEAQRKAFAGAEDESWQEDGCKGGGGAEQSFRPTWVLPMWDQEGLVNGGGFERGQWSCQLISSGL